MEISLRPAHPVPAYVSDTRPTADAAAQARNPRPDVPLPIPPGLSQTAATLSASLVTAARDTSAAEAVRRVTSLEPVQRTLKPYGVAMLPDDAARRAAAEAAREAARDADSAAATEARAEARTRDAEATARAARRAVEDLSATETPPEPTAAETGAEDRAETELIAREA